MIFDIQRKRYCTFDGRTLLKSNIMRPTEPVDFSGKYICDFADICESFVRDELYPALLIKAAESHPLTTTLSYNLNISELYHSSHKSSYAIYSVLESNGVIVASGLKAITFEGDSIIPAKLLSKHKKQILALGFDGNPIALSLSNGILKTEDPC